MLLVVDTGAFDIQLLVHLGLLLVGEIPPIGLTVRPDLLVNFAFLGFQFCRLAGSQLAGSYAVGDPILLVFAPLVHPLLPYCCVAALCLSP